MAYRKGKVIINGKRVNLDECNEIYGDGRFRGTRGISLNLTKTNKIVVERWTNYQGSSDDYEIVSPDEASRILEELPHPGRVARAHEQLEEAGLIEIEEI